MPKSNTIRYNGYFSDVLKLIFNQAVKQDQLTQKMADFLYDQEVKNDLITDLNSHLTTFGQGLFDLLGVEYVVELNNFDEFEYVITFKN